MYLDELPTELLLHVFRSATSIPDVLALAATNRRLHRVFAGSQKLPLLFAAAETQIGPLRDAIQLVTHNTTQPAHAPRPAPHSLALLRQLVAVGAVARRWEALYPLHRWRRDFERRRALRPDEARRLRRAIYRLWLYARAFHNGRFQRGARLQPAVVRARAALLQGWSSTELAELEDARAMLRNALRWRICPSDGTVLRRYRRRFAQSRTDDEDDSDDDDGEWWSGAQRGQDYGRRNHSLSPLDQPLFPAPSRSYAAVMQHVDFHSSPAATSAFRHRQAFPGQSHHSMGPKPDAALIADEGWGDEVPHYYVLEDMLKLDPAQILWLRDHAPCNKPLVENFVKGLGEWFDNNGETCGQTLELVLAERGEDLGDLRDALERRVVGIAID